MFDCIYIQERIIKLECGCWEWNLSRNPHGYGQVTAKSGETLAHRLAWKIYKGPIPTGHGVFHRCDNPPCCNPSHLFTGIQHDNITDMIEKGNHYVNTEAAIKSRMLSLETVLEILKDSKAGYKNAIIAQYYKTSIDTVRRIINDPERYL